MNEVTRRRLLAAGGAVTMGAAAGCTGSAEEDEGGGDEDEADEPREGTVLGDIAVENLSAATREVDVLVEFDEAEDFDHWSTHRLDPGEGADLERGWPTEPSEFRVLARLDGSELTSVTPGTWNDPDCLNLVVVVNRDGDLNILSTPEGGPCADPDDADAPDSNATTGDE